MPDHRHVFLDETHEVAGEVVEIAPRGILRRISQGSRRLGAIRVVLGEHIRVGEVPDAAVVSLVLVAHGADLFGLDVEFPARLATRRVERLLVDGARGAADESVGFGVLCGVGAEME